MKRKRGCVVPDTTLEWKSYARLFNNFSFISSNYCGEWLAKVSQSQSLSLQLLLLSEMLTVPGFMRLATSSFSCSLSVEPLLFHLWNKSQHLLRSRQDHNSDNMDKFFSSILEKHRSNEVLLLQIQRLVPVGSLMEALKLSDKLSYLVLNPTLSRQFEMVQMVLASVKKLQEDAISTTSNSTILESTNYERCIQHFRHNTTHDWAIPLVMWCHQEETCDMLQERLQNLSLYSLDLHILLKDCTTNVGLYPIKFMVQDKCQVLDEQEEDFSANDNFELANQLVQCLDQKADQPEMFLLLRNVLNQMMLADEKKSREWFLKTFDEFRIVVWSKIHFLQACKFGDSLWDKFYGPAWKMNPEVVARKATFDLVTSTAVEGEDSKFKNKLDTFNDDNKDMVTVEYSSILYKCVDVNRDIGFMDKMDFCMAIHVVLKFCEENDLFPYKDTGSVQFRFTPDHVEFAKNVARAYLDEWKNISGQELRVLELIKKEVEESVGNVLYERNRDIILERILKFVNWNIRHEKNEEMARFLTDYVTGKATRTKRAQRERNLSMTTIGQLCMTMRNSLDYQPFREKIKELESEEEEVVLLAAAKLVKQYVEKPLTLETAIFSACAHSSVRKNYEQVLTVLLSHFGPIMKYSQ